MNEGTPTWRIGKDREIAERECKERAREASFSILDASALGDLLTNLSPAEAAKTNVLLTGLIGEPTSLAANKLVHYLQQLAYRRALAVERRREGLPE